MSENSIVVFADSTNQNSYLFLKKIEKNLKIFSTVQASKEINNLHAEIVLIDCGFRNKMGLALLKDVKRCHPRIPVVFLTDASSEDLAIAAFRTGAREYIKKPVNISALRNIINELRQLKRNSKEERLPFGKYQGYPLELAAPKDENIPPRLLEVFTYINENLSENLTLTNLARLINMSKHHFSRHYRKYMGTSPMKHVNYLRINRSKELLLRKDLRITEIAFLVGFDDINKFIRNFKKVTGQTPSEFRKKTK